MRRRLLVFVCLFAVVPGLVVAVPITDTGVSPITTYDAGSMVTDVDVEGHSLQVDGATVYEVTVVANSTRTVDIDARVIVSLETLDGRIVSDGRDTKLLSATGTQTYNVDVTPNATRSDFATMNVTVDT